jgi:HEAT repeat protein
VSQPSEWLPWVVVGLTVTVVVLTLLVLAVWAEGNARQRRRARLTLRWEPLVLEYLCAVDDPARDAAVDRIRSAVAARDLDAFATLVLGYLSELRGDDAERLRVVARALGIVKRARHGLRSRNPWRRALAARALGLLRARGHAGALIDATADRHPVASFAAAAALIQIGGRELVAAAAMALGRRDDWNTAQTHELLDQGGVELGMDLFRLLQRTSPEDPRARTLTEMLGQIRFVDAAATLREWLGRDPPIEVRVSIVRALGRMEDGESADMIRGQLVNPFWVVRSQAALALGRVGDHDAVPALERALQDDSFWVRCNAAIALHQLGIPGREALERAARGSGPTALVAREALGPHAEGETALPATSALSPHTLPSLGRAA